MRPALFVALAAFLGLALALPRAIIPPPGAGPEYELPVQHSIFDFSSWFGGLPDTPTPPPPPNTVVSANSKHPSHHHHHHHSKPHSSHKHDQRPHSSHKQTEPGRSHKHKHKPRLNYKDELMPSHILPMPEEVKVRPYEGGMFPAPWEPARGPRKDGRGAKPKSTPHSHQRNMRLPTKERRPKPYYGPKYWESYDQQSNNGSKNWQKEKPTHEASESS